MRRVLFYDGDLEPVCSRPGVIATDMTAGVKEKLNEARVGTLN